MSALECGELARAMKTGTKQQGTNVSALHTRCVVDLRHRDGSAQPRCWHAPVHLLCEIAVREQVCVCVCVVVGGRVFRNFLPRSLHRPGC